MPKFVRDIVIKAPVEKVWQVITDPTRWPQWFPGVESVANLTSLNPGGTFEWVTNGKTGQATIASMEPMKRLEVHTQLENDKDKHVFTLQPSGGFLGMGGNDCKVTYVLDTLMGGGIFSNFVAGGNPKDVLAVKNTMDHLKKVVLST